jgi:2-polyprenyl-6-methoxyphenol hydroxylase-like FAD-dependent oxidoreductase
MPRAIIVGGSLAGLSAAALLARRGLDADVFERATSALEGRGAGIVTHPDLLDGLAACGATLDATLGVHVPERIVLACDGSVIGTRQAGQILTSWERLYSLLRQAVPADRYHLGKRLVAIEETSERITAQFDDGSSATGDLLVGADGIRSQVRSIVHAQTAPRYAGYVAWRGMAREADLSEGTRAAFFCRFAFCLPDSEQILGYPVAGPGNSVAAGERRFNFVWYRPADEVHALASMLTDAHGTLHAAGIPPQLIRPELVAATLADARRLLAPQFAEAVSATKAPFFQPILDLESTRLAFGRVGLIGDAAFVARPHVGMGVSKAMGDAVALADCLAEVDPRRIAQGLRAYEALRLPEGATIVARARRLGAYMQAQRNDGGASVRFAADVMAETALHADFWSNPSRRRLPSWAGGSQC